MNTCETCQYWFREDQAQLKHKNLGRGICLKATMVSRASVTYNDQNSLALAASLIGSALSPSLVIAQLETLPEFGCNQHSKKDG